MPVNVVIPFVKRDKSRASPSSGRSRQDGFSQLVRPHLPALHRLAYRFTGRQQDAEDLLQELLTRLYIQAERLDGIQSLRPWLARALYNLYIDERRRLSRSPLGRVHSTAVDESAEEHLARSQMAPNTDLDVATEMAQLRGHLGELVERLPDEQRDVVILHDVEGYELPEVAEVLGLALGTAKSRLHRGHQRLRAWLRQRNLSPATVVLSREGSGVEPGVRGTRVSNDEVY